MFRSREQYDDFVNSLPEESRLQWWPVPWKFATWSERLVIALIWSISSVVIVSLLLLTIYLFGTMIDSHAAEMERTAVCLQHSVNGQEIKQCQ